MKHLTRPSWAFNLAAHDIRSTIPAAIRPAIQNGMLELLFQDALVPEFLFPMGLDVEPIPGRRGDTITKTRTGLLAPTTTPLNGADVSASTYGLEQWSVTIDRYGQAVDTDLDGSATALASQYARDVQTLGINAGQSLNRLARNKLYAAYGTGRTHATAAGTSATALVVQDARGFDTVLVNGVPTAVSAGNPLAISIGGGAPVNVTAVNVGTNTLTLASAQTWVNGASVVAANAPAIVRPAARNSRFEYVAGDVATLSRFRAAVARLRGQAVPTVDGYYVAHIDATTEAQLFDDADFKQALQGRVDSPVFRDMSIGRFSGIDWVRNLEVPTAVGGSGGTLTVRQPIVLGAGALIASPAEWLGDRDAETAQSQVSTVETPAGVDVELIVRLPQDRLQRVVSTAWSWVGDFGVPSDATASSNDPARYKRAVVVEHVG